MGRDDASPSGNLVEWILRLPERCPVHLLEQLVLRQELMLKEDNFRGVLFILISQSIDLLLRLHVDFIEILLGLVSKRRNFIFRTLLLTVDAHCLLAIRVRFLHLGDCVGAFGGY